MSVYRVTSKRPYRGRLPGTTFEANIGPNAVRRAIARGDIELVDSSTPTLQPGSFTLPVGWPPRDLEGITNE